MLNVVWIVTIDPSTEQPYNPITNKNKTVEFEN